MDIGGPVPPNGTPSDLPVPDSDPPLHVFGDNVLMSMGGPVPPTGTPRKLPVPDSDWKKDSDPLYFFEEDVMMGIGGPVPPKGTPSNLPVPDTDPLMLLGRMLEQERKVLLEFLANRHGDMLKSIDGLFAAGACVPLGHACPLIDAWSVNRTCSKSMPLEPKIPSEQNDNVESPPEYPSAQEQKLSSWTRAASPRGAVDCRFAMYNRYSEAELRDSVSAITDSSPTRARSRNSGNSGTRSGTASGPRYRSSMNATYDEETSCCCLSHLIRTVTSLEFESVFAALIVANLLMLCLEAQYLGYDSCHKLGYKGCSRSGSSHWPYAETIFSVLDTCFGIAFSIEVIFKVSAFGLDFFRSAWNWFDGFVIVSWAAHLILKDIILIDLSILRVARIVRLLRTFRLLKTVQSFAILHLLVASLHASFNVLMWTIVFLVGIMTVGALIMVAVIDIYISDDANQIDKRKEAYTYFGNFGRSLLSVFEVTLGNWAPIARFLHENVSEWFGIVIMVYLCVVGFAVVMVIRGIFLHETFTIAGSDDDLMINRQHRTKIKTVRKMEVLFSEADDSGDGYLSYDEFMEVMHDPRVTTWLEAMGLEVGDAKTMFQMVDDGDNRISAREFVSGFMRLKGSAKSIDMVENLRVVRNMAMNLQGVAAHMGIENVAQTMTLAPTNRQSRRSVGTT